MKEKLFGVVLLDGRVFGKAVHLGEESGGLAGKTSGAVSLPFFGFVFRERGWEVLGFVVEEEFGKAIIGKVGMKVGKFFCGIGISDGGKADAILLGREAIIEGGFGVKRFAVVLVGGMLVFKLF